MQSFRQRTGKRGKTVASVKHLVNGVMLQVDVPFNKEFTESLKKSIPAKKRIWDNNDKCWYVVKDHLDRLTYLLSQYFDETILVDFPAHEVSTSAWEALYLTQNAPIEIVRASYTALAKLYHPDRGGDTAIMQRINQAYKMIVDHLKETEK